MSRPATGRTIQLGRTTTLNRTIQLGRVPLIGFEAEPQKEQGQQAQKGQK